MTNENVYEIGQAYIKIDIKADDEFKQAFEKHLLFLGKVYAKEYYKKDYLIGGLYFTVELEDGSLISRLKIYGRVLITSLVAYGGVRSGIDYFVKDSQAVTEHVVQDISNNQNIGQRIQRVERRLGVPGKIQRLYKDMDKLNRSRNNLTEDEQQILIDKIHRNFEELVIELDQNELQIIQQDLTQRRIPISLPNGNDGIYAPRLYGTKEDEIRLISENEINEDRELPSPNQ